MRVLVAYDGSECADAALDDVGRACLPAPVEALVLAVADLDARPPSPRAADAESVEGRVWQTAHDCALQDAAEWARRGANRLKDLQPTWNVASEVEMGSPAGVLVGRARSWPADLVVVGSHGRSALGRAVFGSVSQQVLHHGPSNVRVARGGPSGERPGGVRIVVGVDGSPGGESAVAAVRGRRWPAGSAVRVVTAVTPGVLGGVAAATGDWGTPQDRLRAINGAAVGELRSAGLAAAAVLVDADPKHALVDQAREWGADVVFVGEHGLHGAARAMLGSVAAAVAARAPCSVEIVRSRPSATR